MDDKKSEYNMMGGLHLLKWLDYLRDITHCQIHQRSISWRTKKQKGCERFYSLYFIERPHLHRKSCYGHRPEITPSSV